MSALAVPQAPSVEDRARQSQGTSAAAIYEMVARTLNARHRTRGTLIDVGCGTANLWPYVQQQFDHYVGADVVRYEGFPADSTFVPVNLDSGQIDLPAASADVVVAIETIEHLENPRAFMRELVRLAKPGGCVAVTTPNQLSLLSKLTLLFRNEFNAFRAGCYPAHITALLEVDLRRMARELNLTDLSVGYSHLGRVVLTPWHYPRFLSRLCPRACSDNLMIVARKENA